MKQGLKSDSQFVSVVMPAYNSSGTIRESIQSVINQTFKNWELVIVNDASNDDTKQIVEEYIELDNRIRIINKEVNQGVGLARNTGVFEAKANWIAFLDSDDLWTNDKLEKMMKMILDNPHGKLFFSGSAFITYDGKKSDYYLEVPSKINFKQLLKQNVISCSSVIVAKECILNQKMPSGFLHEDYATWLSILKKEAFAYGYNEPLLIYRLSTSSKSGNKIKAVQMNWNTYRMIGVPLWLSVKSMIIYAYRSIKKYSSI